MIKQDSFDAYIIIVTTTEDKLQGIIRAIEALDRSAVATGEKERLNIGIIHGVTTGVLDPASAIIANMAGAIVVHTLDVTIPDKDDYGNKIYSLEIDVPNNMEAGEVVTYIGTQHINIIDRILEVAKNITPPNITTDKEEIKKD